MLAKKGFKESFNFYHEFTLMLFCLFCVGVASQTIIPKLEFGIVSLGIVDRNLWGTINLIPGKVFLIFIANAS